MYVVSIDTTYYLVVITTKYIFWFINQNIDICSTNIYLNI